MVDHVFELLFVLRCPVVSVELESLVVHLEMVNGIGPGGLDVPGIAPLTGFQQHPHGNDLIKKRIWSLL
jgi:hypothetical protein